MDPQSLPKPPRKIHKFTNYILIDLRDLLGNHHFFKNPDISISPSVKHCA